MNLFTVRSAAGHYCLTTKDKHGRLDPTKVCAACAAHLRRHAPPATAPAPPQVLRAAGVRDPEGVPAPPTMLSAVRSMRGLAPVAEPARASNKLPAPRVATQRRDQAPPAPPSMAEVARELRAGRLGDAA